MTIEAIKRAARDRGSYFFEPSTMRFFRSRVSSKTFARGKLVYFVTSEQFVFRGQADRRKYKVRSFDTETGNIETVSDEIRSLSTAVRMARKLAQGK